MNKCIPLIKYFCRQQEGTLKPWPAFDAERDCEKLRAAMKGMGKLEMLRYIYVLLVHKNGLI